MLQPARLIEKFEKQFTGDFDVAEIFDVNGSLWGFEGKNVMPTPLQTKSVLVIEWDRKYPEIYPFKMPQPLINREIQIPWTYKNVYQNPANFDTYCIRTDVCKVAWVFWWWFFRIEASFDLFVKFCVYLLQVWGLAEVEFGEMPSWRNIKILQTFWVRD